MVVAKSLNHRFSQKASKHRRVNSRPDWLGLARAAPYIHLLGDVGHSQGTPHNATICLDSLWIWCPKSSKNLNRVQANKMKSKMDNSVPKMRLDLEKRLEFFNNLDGLEEGKEDRSRK